MISRILVLGFIVIVTSACAGGGRPGGGVPVVTPSPAVAPAPAPQVAAPNPAAPVALIQKFNLRLVAGALNGSDLSLDPSGQDYLGSNRTVVSDRAASVPDTILLPSALGGTNTDLFFVFSRDAFGSATIRRATFQLEQKGNAEIPLQEVSFDKDSGNYYIPLSGLLGAKWTRAAEADRHDLILDLDLDDDQSFELRTTFSAAGFPAGSANGATIASSSGGDLASAISSGRPFYTETVTNSTDHSLTLWVRLDPNQSLELDAWIQNSDWLPQHPDMSNPRSPGCLPIHSASERVCQPIQTQDIEQSSARVMVSSLSISGSTLSVGQLGAWNAVSVPAQKSVTLAWQLSPAPGVNRCQVSGSIARTINWSEPIGPGCSSSPGSPCQPPYPAYIPAYFKDHSESYSQDWSVTGAELKGQWSRRLVLAEPFVTSEQLDNLAASSADIRSRVQELLNPPFRAEDVRAGQIGGSSASFNCQGTF